MNSNRKPKDEGTENNPPQGKGGKVVEEDKHESEGKNAPANTNATQPVGAIKSRKEKRKEKRDASKPVEEVKEKTAEELEQEQEERYQRAQEMKGREPPHYVHLRNSDAYRLNIGNDIRVVDYTLQVPGRKLLESASFTLAYGHRYGLVGRNGGGKSTLLKRIADREGISISTHLKVLYVEQEVPGDDTVPIEYVLQSDEERVWLLKEEAALLRLSEEQPFWMDNPDEKRAYSLKDIQERLFDIQSAKAKPRATAILTGLGFDSKEISKKPSREYSGGWRMRIALARALFCRPDVLLLDEPTNHLDLHACFWLEQYLAKWKSTLLVVSHEATFLDEIVDRIIEIRAGKLNAYKGNYWNYVHTRDIIDKTKTKQMNNLANELEHLNNVVNHTRTTGRRNTGKTKIIEEIQARMTEVIKDDPSLRVSFPDPDLVAPPLCQFQEVSFGYDPAKPLFKKLDMSIDMESRIALVGLNGVGKSTLLKLMVGELKETDGYVFRNRKARVAKFSQHSLEQLNASETPIEYLATKFGSGSKAKIQQQLGRFGIFGQTAKNKIETLSGGQKSRVVLAELSWAEPHVLFLDEPSNHLDLDAIDGLVQGLKTFKGGIVLISHNQHLISVVCTEIWVVKPGGRVERFNGDFEEYKDQIISKMASLSDSEDEKEKEKEKKEKEEKEKKEKEEKDQKAKGAKKGKGQEEKKGKEEKEVEKPGDKGKVVKKGRRKKRGGDSDED